MSQITPLSDITFILPKNHPQRDLYFKISQIVFEDEFLQIELSAYHIWNCVFHYGDNRNHWPIEEIISKLPLDSIAWVEKEIKKGKQLCDLYKKKYQIKQIFFIHYKKLPPPVIPKEWQEQKTPKKFQADILNNFGKATFQSGIYNIRGGAGKTLLALWIFLKEPCTTLVIVPKKILIQQWWQELANLFGQELSIVKTVFDKKLFILTHNQLSQALNEVQYHKIIIDEVHHIDKAMLEVLNPFMGKIIGLTATPHFSLEIHQDVFTAVGPVLFVYDYRQEKKFKKQIKIVEVEIEMRKEEKIKYYSNSKKREKFIMASCAKQKVDILKKLLTSHSKKKIIVIGYFNQQLESIAYSLKLPFYSSKISEGKKLKLLEEFNRGKINTLLMGSVGNEGINMPDVNIIIQVSGNADDSTEEFQRLGRLTRDKEGELIFYTFITKGTIEETSHSKRKIELAKNGFNYDKKIRLS